MAMTEVYGKNDNSVLIGAYSCARLECVDGWMRRWRFRANQIIGGIAHNTDTSNTDDADHSDNANHATCGWNDSDQRK